MKKYFVIVLFLLLALVQSVSADTTIFQNGNCTTGGECGTILGYAGTQDTFIQEQNLYNGGSAVFGGQRTDLYMSHDDTGTTDHGYQIYHYADGGTTRDYIDTDPNRTLTHKDSYHDTDSWVLVQFDLGTYIPENMRIISAELQMYKAHDTADPIVSVYKVTEGPWVEGNVSWNYRVPGDNTTAWNGAMDASLIDTIDVLPAAGWYSWDVSSAVSEWYDGFDPNYGFVLKQETTNYGWGDTSYKFVSWTDGDGDGLRDRNEVVFSGRDGNPEENVNLTQIWYSSEYGNQCLRPKLIVTYEPVPEPATLLLLGLGLVGLAGMRKRFKK